jgi:hypothetical protein
LNTALKFAYPEIGICGLSCRVCPAFHRETKSKCNGCKTEARIKAGCTFIRCALKNKTIEFCWQCEESRTCKKWKKHKKFSKEHDSFVCYQKLEDNIAFIQSYGIECFEQQQEIRKHLLEEMLGEFNEGRSKTYLCIATTVMEIEELKKALGAAKEKSKGLNVKAKSKILHKLLDQIAGKKHYHLKLRK